MQDLDRIVIWADGYKTRVDISYPAAPAPLTGWPGVAVIHGFGGDRKSASTRECALELAKRGYMTFAYDFRGQGDTLLLNAPPHDDSTTRLTLDSADIFLIVKSYYPAALDQTRLGMTGISWGGRQATNAAAMSGRALPPGGLVGTFPNMRAVVTQIAALDRVEDYVSGGWILNSECTKSLSNNPASALWQAALNMRQDIVRNLLSGDPMFNIFPLLQQSNVPLLAMMAADDDEHLPYVTLDRLANLAPGTPRKGILTTGGHGSPENTVERRWIQDQTARWFDNFMKGTPSGILAEPHIETACAPVEPLPYRLPGSEWKHRFSSSWPPATTSTPMFLRGNGTLSAVAPPAVEPSATFPHRVLAGYDLAGFVADGVGRNVPAVMAKVPMLSHSFTGAPLTDDLELFGRPHFSTLVQSFQGDLQLSVALLALDAQLVERYLCGGSGAVRLVNPGIHQLSFDLRDVATVVPKGSRLVVRIENLDRHRPPGEDRIVQVPLLFNFDASVLIDPVSNPRLMLPIADPQIGLTPRLRDDAAADGIAHQMTLDGGTSAAGVTYGLLLSGSGFAPGLPFAPGVTLPLNPDPFTNFAAGLVNTPAFPGWFGVLDAQGRASASLLLPAPIANQVRGLRLTTSGLAIRNGFWHAFGPSEFDIQ